MVCAMKTISKAVPVPPPAVVAVPAPAAPHLISKPVTRCDIAAWLMMAAGLLIAVNYHLISGLLAGLFVYAVIHRITSHLQEYRMERNHAKVAAVLFVSVAIIAATIGIVLFLIGLVKGRVADMPEMLHKITAVVESLRGSIRSPAIEEHIPDAEKLHGHVVAWLKDYSQHWPEFTAYTGRLMVHSILGIVIAAFLCFHVPHKGGPLAMSFFERMARLSDSFEKVFFAQVKISAVNTTMTATYLFIILPALGYRLPFRGTMLLVTFFCGLLPVIGNLISNSIILVLSLDLSAGVALGSFVFLVVVHKLEYFLNARIIGGQIESSAWEILAVMMVAEAVFGIPGVIIAPVVYAYVKYELKDYGLV